MLPQPRPVRGILCTNGHTEVTTSPANCRHSVTRTSRRIGVVSPTEIAVTYVSSCFLRRSTKIRYNGRTATRSHLWPRIFTGAKDGRAVFNIAAKSHGDG